MKNKSKTKKNNIPLCPSKIKPIKKRINKIKPQIGHWRQPSTPSQINTKIFNLNNNLNILSNKKYNKYSDNKDESKQNIFHFFIPRSKSYSENNLKKQKIILIKKINYSEKVPFNFKNIKEYNYKKGEIINNIQNNIFNSPDINNKNIIKDKDKDTISLNNSHYMNNTKANTISNTTIGISQNFSDRILKEENNSKIKDEKISKNPLEFTFGEINFFQNHITKTKSIKNPYFNMTSASQSSIDNNTNKIQNININKCNSRKNIFMENIIKNMKLNRQKIILNNQFGKNKNNDETNYYFTNIKSYSNEKDMKIKEKNIISKFISFPKVRKTKILDIKESLDEKHKTPKNPKKFLNLIPVDKKYNLNKKNKLIIKNHLDNNDNNKNINLKMSISIKNKVKKNNLHKVFINQNSNSNKHVRNNNKSNPKLFLKHPSFKDLFDS